MVPCLYTSPVPHPGYTTPAPRHTVIHRHQAARTAPALTRTVAELTVTDARVTALSPLLSLLLTLQATPEHSHLESHFAGRPGPGYTSEVQEILETGCAKVSKSDKSGSLGKGSQQK